MCSEVKTSADTCTVLLWPAVWAPAPVLDLCPHWGQEESPEEPDWSQYEVMHCLQNQCPQLVETGSFRTSSHEVQQGDCSSSETWLLFLSLWRHFLITHMSQSQVVTCSENWFLPVCRNVLQIQIKMSPQWIPKWFHKECVGSWWRSELFDWFWEISHQLQWSCVLMQGPD